jgi:hypothetical protein
LTRLSITGSAIDRAVLAIVRVVRYLVDRTGSRESRGRKALMSQRAADHDGLGVGGAP